MSRNPRQRFTLFSSLLLASLGFFAQPTHAIEASINPKIVIRVDSPGRKIEQPRLTVHAGRHQANILSVRDTNEAPLTIALVIDVGSNQVWALGREKELASGLISDFSDRNTSFLLIRAGFRPAAISSADPLSSVQQLTTEASRKAKTRIYDGMALALQELSHRPGMRVLVVIAEGNDSGSHISYKRLHEYALAQHTSVMTAVVADHSTHGTKAIYIYGWNLQDISNKTAGISIDNERHTARALSKLTNAIRSLRVVSLSVEDLPPGLYKAHLSADGVGRVHAQKQICVGGAVACSGYEE